MKNKHLIFILSILISLIFSQQNTTYGFSVSTSDNLDAIFINPAGLGISRGTQFGINIRQTSNIDDLENNSNLYKLNVAHRLPIGLAFNHEYDEINKYQSTIAFGTKLTNNFYIGFSFKKNNYITGFLYRPTNYISTGLSYITNKNDNFRHVRYGIAIKPFSFFNKQKYKKTNFLNYSNLTLGYDKLINYDDNFKSEYFNEYYFLSFDIIPGINFGFQKYPSSYAINLSFNFGNSSTYVTTYPSNPFYENQGSITYSGIGYQYGSQKKETKLDLLSITKNNFIELKLEGHFIEEKPTKNLFDEILNINFLPFNNNKIKGVQLRTFINNIYKLSHNNNISGLIINLGNIQAGMAKRKEIFDALMYFKNQNKEIIVYCNKNIISNNDYYIISLANKIYTNHHTAIDLKGLNMEVLFIKGLLDSTYITPEVVRVSEYKTAADIILNNQLSDEAKENYTQLSESLFNTMVNDISKARNWDNNTTLTIINNGPYYLPSLAKDANLINDTMYEDDFYKLLKNKKYNIVKWNEIISNDYYIDEWKIDDIPKIAIIYAVGGIISGKSNPGSRGSTLMGDETITKAIKKARNDKNVKAIVLRIDSGGGSVLASDNIWHEVEKTTNANSKNKKPVIVSMSDVAASGGYYIACESDEIIANPMTITGSIGVIWARLNFIKLLNKIGITYDNIKQGNNSDFGSSKHLLTEKEKDAIFNTIMKEYNDFKSKVIKGRDSLNDMDELDKIANGRVWTGKDSKNNKLIDKEGGLLDAINRAKELSFIKNDSEINIVEYPKVNPFSFFKFSKNENASIINLKEILPEDLSNKLEVLNLIPVIMDNNIQLLMPYQINLN